MASAKQERGAVLADGTAVDQEYYQSKNYILSQLEQRKGSEKKSETDKDKEANLDKTTKGMLKSGAISEDDGWLLASMELAIRNPFCVANHPAPDQMKFYQKVFGISALFMGMVAFATLMWTWWWGVIVKGGTKPIMPCNGNGGSFGVVRLCNDTSADFNTEIGDDGCDESAPLSICVQDSCIESEDDLRSCWYIGAFIMVVCATYMMLLFRRDQAGKGLLACACFVEGVLGGAATLHYDSSVFLEFFFYLFCATLLCLIIFTKMCGKNMEEWEKLPNQVGSTKLTVPEVETNITGVIKKAFAIGAGIVCIIALLWHFAIPTRLTGGSHLAFFLALFALWVGVGWIIKEIMWTQHKYDPDQVVNMCISFHVDLFCMFILVLIFFLFVINDSCHQGPIGCLPACCYMIAMQGERCGGFCCGARKGSMHTEAGQDGTEAAGDQGKSTHVEKEVETDEARNKRKMLNAACGVGIIALTGLSFFVPQLSFAVAFGICVGLPFFRAIKNKEEDHSNV